MFEPKQEKHWRSTPVKINGKIVYPLGFLIRGEMMEKGEANPYGIYMITNREDFPPFVHYSYRNIRNNFYWLRVLGFIMFRRSEPSSKTGLKDKNFYELTSKGKQALDEEWRNIRKTYGNRS